MDYKKLVEKYWIGETSLEEEKLLKQYFNGQEIDEDLKPYQSTFQYFKTQQKIVSPSTTLDNLPKEEGKIISLKKAYSYQLFLRIAASILFLLTIGFWYQNRVELPKEERLTNYWESKEIKDPKLAYKQAKAALLLASTKLNRGTEVALNQVIKVQKAGKIIKLK